MLVAIEMGLRNHEFVPLRLIEKISHLKHANIYKLLGPLLKNKLVSHEVQKKRLSNFIQTMDID